MKLPLALLSFFYVLASVFATPVVNVIKGVPYEAGTAEDVLDLYLPGNAEEHKVVVFIHGGGWIGGSRIGDRDVAVARSLAEAGFAVASIDYRLAPASHWPAQLDDIRSALRFLSGHAKDYQLDMSRIALFGCSAGGHLALMAAYEESPDKSLPTIRAVVAFYPISNLLTRRETDAAGQSLAKVKESTGVKLLGYPLAAHESLWKDASPSSHVTSVSPPTFLAHGKKDTTVNWEQTAELDSILQAAKVDHETIFLEQAGHSFDLTEWKHHPLEKDLTPLVVAFLQKHLK